MATRCECRKVEFERDHHLPGCPWSDGERLRAALNRRLSDAGHNMSEQPQPPCCCREDDDGFTVILDTSDCPRHHWEPIR